MEHLAFALSVTGPIFLMIIAGYLLSTRGVVRERFIDDASRLVFHITLPALLFISIYTSNAKPMEEIPLLTAGILGSFIMIPLAWLLARPVMPGDRSAFIQGAYRGNAAIIGLAWVEKAYGVSGVSHSAALVAALTIQFNVIAVVLFVLYNQNTGFGWRKLALELFKNPLILGVIAAILCRILEVKLPDMLRDTIQYLASVSLPLGLICIGASMKLGLLLHSSPTALVASLLKLVAAPAIALVIGWMMGLRPEYLGYLLLMTGAPCAISAFVMAHSMGGNSQLTANIVGLSTLLSVVTASIGLALLKVYF
ncbi:AEC family transporter [Microbulbifer sp. 2205BS26-8]|uniref:AEC family transporter n=1 Tax=Microbulbifer sp. 2205BS26-8 TaxID=3064386 RepID=UPI00273E05AB|nr:AEC family transporter [Microbulbifer sp. 2205BS26-8]MDP5210509.1 AEC family transporter [Microbulbifer sp. 2205BS26-8]